MSGPYATAYDLGSADRVPIVSVTYDNRSLPEDLNRKIVPKSLAIMEPAETVSTIREPISFQSRLDSYNTSTRQPIVIEVPAHTHLDFRYGAISCKVTIAVTGGAYARLAQGAWTMFDRQRALQFKQPFEDRENTDEATSLRYATSQTLEWSSVQAYVFGVGTQAQRNTWGATAGQQYFIPLELRSIQQCSLYKTMMDKEIEIELNLANPLRFVETDGTNPVVTLTEVKLIGELVHTEPELEASMHNLRIKNGINLSYTATKRYRNQINSTDPVLRIPHFSSAVRTIMTLLRQNGEENNPAINDKHLRWYQGGVDYYYAKMGTQRFPQTNIQALTYDGAYMQLLKYQGAQSIGGGFHNTTANIHWLDFTTVQFLMIIDLTSCPTDNGVNTISTNLYQTDTEFYIHFSSAPGSTYYADTWVTYHEALTKKGPSGQWNIKS